MVGGSRPGWSAGDERVLAGGLLAGSFLLLVVALVVLVVSGAFPAFLARISGSLPALAEHADAFRLDILLFAIAWIVQLLGLALLARMLLRAVDEPLVVIALVLVGVGAILAVLNVTFRMTVEVWAAEEVAATGVTPAFYEPFREWTRSFFKIGYVAYLMGVGGLGLAIIRAGLPNQTVGWVAAGWSALWLAGSFVGAGAPAIPLVMPAVIGLALLRRPVIMRQTRPGRVGA